MVSPLWFYSPPPDNYCTVPGAESILCSHFISGMGKSYKSRKACFLYVEKRSKPYSHFSYLVKCSRWVKCTLWTLQAFSVQSRHNQLFSRSFDDKSILRKNVAKHAYTYVFVRLTDESFFLLDRCNVMLLSLHQKKVRV